MTGTPAGQLLRIRDVCAKLAGVHRATVYRLIAEAGFPQPVAIGGNAVAWHAHEVDAWIAARPRAGTTRAA
jgi:prophage regulatory protein